MLSKNYTLNLKTWYNAWAVKQLIILGLIIAQIKNYTTINT